MEERTLDQVLSQRRQAVAEVVNVDEPMVMLAIFELAGQAFAFYGSGIREIQADATVLFVPGCPPSLEGVINVRGDIESVIRLADVLQLSPGESGRVSTILLGQAKEMRSGIRVEKVLDVVAVAQSLIQPAPSTLSEPLRSLVLGIVDFQGRPVAVLDLEKLFSDYARALI